MTLPVSPNSISLSQVNVELGRSATASINMNESAVRTLAGRASGAISMSDLHGKTFVTFSPDGGTSAGAAVGLFDSATYPQNAQIDIVCNQSAVWTWSGGGTGSSVIPASGGSATTISFFLTSQEFGQRTASFTVSGTAAGVTRYWTVELLTFGLD